MAMRESEALLAATQQLIAGLDRNYAPMAEIFRSVIARTLRAQARPSS
jgi:hypothetical protein